MAEDIVFSTSIDDDGRGAKSLRQLKQEFKDLQKELQNTRVGTDEYNKTLQKLGAVKDDIGDLNQTISALNPEGKVQAFANVAGKLAGGFQAATGAAALFGIQSEELEKTLLRVQAATALAQGIQSVVGLTDAFKVLGAVIAANPIMTLVTVITGITAAVIAFNIQNENSVKIINDLSDAIARENKELNDLKNDYSDHAELMAAKGEDQIAVQKIRIEGIKAERIALKSIQEQYHELYKLTDGKKQEEALSKEEEAAEKRIRLKKQLAIEEAKLERMISEEEKKESEKRNEDAKKRQEARIKEQIRAHRQNEKERLEAEAIINAELQAEFDEIAKQIEAEQQEEDLAAYLDFEYRKMMEGLNVEKLGVKMKKDIDDQARKEKEKADAEARSLRIKEEQLYFSAVSDLSSTFFNLQLANAKGNAAEEEKIRRKQFQADKALRAVQSIINTAEGITEASPNVPLMVATGFAGAASLAKILSTQYNGGNSGGATAVDVGAFQVQTSAPQPVTTPLTRLNEQGQNLTRAYVVETDITDSQRRINRLAEQATFG